MRTTRSVEPKIKKFEDDHGKNYQMLDDWRSNHKYRSADDGIKRWYRIKQNQQREESISHDTLHGHLDSEMTRCDSSFSGATSISHFLNDTTVSPPQYQSYASIHGKTRNGIEPQSRGPSPVPPRKSPLLKRTVPSREWTPPNGREMDNSSFRNHHGSHRSTGSSRNVSPNKQNEQLRYNRNTSPTKQNAKERRDDYNHRQQFDQNNRNSSSGHRNFPGFTAHNQNEQSLDNSIQRIREKCSSTFNGSRDILGKNDTLHSNKHPDDSHATRSSQASSQQIHSARTPRSNTYPTQSSRGSVHSVQTPTDQTISSRTPEHTNSGRTPKEQTNSMCTPREQMQSSRTPREVQHSSQTPRESHSKKSPREELRMARAAREDFLAARTPRDNTRMTSNRRESTGSPPPNISRSRSPPHDSNDNKKDKASEERTLYEERQARESENLRDIVKRMQGQITDLRHDKTRLATEIRLLKFNTLSQCSNSSTTDGQRIQSARGEFTDSSRSKRYERNVRTQSARQPSHVKGYSGRSAQQSGSVRGVHSGAPYSARTTRTSHNGSLSSRKSSLSQEPYYSVSPRDRTQHVSYADEHTREWTPPRNDQRKHTPLYEPRMQEWDRDGQREDKNSEQRHEPDRIKDRESGGIKNHERPQGSLSNHERVQGSDTNHERSYDQRTNHNNSLTGNTTVNNHSLSSHVLNDTSNHEPAVQSKTVPIAQDVTTVNAPSNQNYTEMECHTDMPQKQNLESARAALSQNNDHFSEKNTRENHLGPSILEGEKELPKSDTISCKRNPDVDPLSLQHENSTQVHEPNDEPSPGKSGEDHDAVMDTYDCDVSQCQTIPLHEGDRSIDEAFLSPSPRRVLAMQASSDDHPDGSPNHHENHAHAGSRDGPNRINTETLSLGAEVIQTPSSMPPAPSPTQDSEVSYRLHHQRHDAAAAELDCGTPVSYKSGMSLSPARRRPSPNMGFNSVYNQPPLLPRFNTSEQLPDHPTRFTSELGYSPSSSSTHKDPRMDRPLAAPRGCGRNAWGQESIEREANNEKEQKYRHNDFLSADSHHSFNPPDRYGNVNDTIHEDKCNEWAERNRRLWDLPEKKDPDDFYGYNQRSQSCPRKLTKQAREAMARRFEAYDEHRQYKRECLRIHLEEQRMGYRHDSTNSLGGRNATKTFSYLDDHVRREQRYLKRSCERITTRMLEAEAQLEEEENTFNPQLYKPLGAGPFEFRQIKYENNKNYKREILKTKKYLEEEALIKKLERSREPQGRLRDDKDRQESVERLHSKEKCLHCTRLHPTYSFRRTQLEKEEQARLAQECQAFGRGARPQGFLENCSCTNGKPRLRSHTPPQSKTSSNWHHEFSFQSVPPEYTSISPSRRSHDHSCYDLSPPSLSSKRFEESSRTESISRPRETRVSTFKVKESIQTSTSPETLSERQKRRSTLGSKLWEFESHTHTQSLESQARRHEIYTKHRSRLPASYDDTDRIKMLSRLSADSTTRASSSQSPPFIHLSRSAHSDNVSNRTGVHGTSPRNRPRSIHSGISSIQTIPNQSSLVEPEGLSVPSAGRTHFDRHDKSSYHGVHTSTGGPSKSKGHDRLANYDKLSIQAEGHGRKNNVFLTDVRSNMEIDNEGGRTKSHPSEDPVIRNGEENSQSSLPVLESYLDSVTNTEMTPTCGTRVKLGSKISSLGSSTRLASSSSTTLGSVVPSPCATLSDPAPQGLQGPGDEPPSRPNIRAGSTVGRHVPQPGISGKRSHTVDGSTFTEEEFHEVITCLRAMVDYRSPRKVPKTTAATEVLTKLKNINYYKIPRAKSTDFQRKN